MSLSKAKKIAQGASAFLHMASAVVKAGTKEARIINHISALIDAFVADEPLPQTPADLAAKDDAGK